jgi:uncharacterized membrane protein YkvA (DUF1232 family)
MRYADLEIDREVLMAARLLTIWERRINRLKTEVYAIYLAYKDPRVPWYAKILIVCILGYAFSPVDKFLNSIPMIGYLDHLILVPLGVVWAFRKMIPSAVLTDCRETAMHQDKTKTWRDGFIIMLIWFLFASLTVVSTIWVVKDWNLVLGQWFRWLTRMALTAESNTR